MGFVHRSMEAGYVEGAGGEASPQGRSSGGRLLSKLSPYESEINLSGQPFGGNVYKSYEFSYVPRTMILFLRLLLHSNTAFSTR